MLFKLSEYSLIFKNLILNNRLANSACNLESGFMKTSFKQHTLELRLTGAISSVVHGLGAHKVDAAILHGFFSPKWKTVLYIFFAW